MSERDGGAVAALWVVTVVAVLTFGWFTLAALDHDMSVALYGIAGVGLGALVATVIQMSRARARSAESAGAVEALAERMRAFELEQERVAELEERVEFAERLLARPLNEEAPPRH